MVVRVWFATCITRFGRDNRSKSFDFVFKKALRCDSCESTISVE